MKEILLFAVFVSLLCAYIASNDGIGGTEGEVVFIEDGDSIALLNSDGIQKKIQLAFIDAPELGASHIDKNKIAQPYAKSAVDYLESRIKNKSVKVRCFGLDDYGRSVCEVFLSGTSINTQMVAEGLAWVTVTKNGLPPAGESLPRVESEAKSSRRGLWESENPIPPWEWKKYCWKMMSCPQ